MENAKTASQNQQGGKGIKAVAGNSVSVLGNRHINFDDINDRALEYAEKIFDMIGLEGEMRGKEYVCLNPNRSDTELGSFQFNTVTGAWADFAGDDDAKGLGVISFVKYILNYTYYEAADYLKKWLEKHYPLDSSANTTITESATPANQEPPKQDGWTIVQPVPADAPTPSGWFGDKLGKPALVSSYKDSIGNVLGYILRFQLAGGKKQPLPYTLWKDVSGAMKWRLKSFPVPRPLYNLDQLAAKPDAPVLLVEGEKSAVAAMKLFAEHVVTTGMGGANGASKTDLTPLYGRDVTIWPDNDDAGRGYASAIAIAMINHDHTAQVKIMKPLMYVPMGAVGIQDRTDQLPVGYDAADAVDEGWTGDLIKLLPADMYSVFGQSEPEARACENSAGQKRELPFSNVERVKELVGMFNGHLHYVNREPYAYKNGHWPLLNERVDVEQLIALYLGKTVSKARIAELLSLVQIFQAKSDSDVAPDMNLICLLNGTLDTRTGELIPHSPDHNLRSQINCVWDVSATCLRWVRFLDEIFVNDPDKAEKIRLVQEWMGYCLTPDNSQHKFLWMVGAGGNGKSVILHILTLLVGRRNVSDAHIERLGDKFVRAELEGKLVNISAEMSAEATIADGYLKSIVSGDQIEAERKFRDSFSFRPYVRLIGSTNHLPRLLDLSDGFFRRAIVLKFNRQFRDDERDPKLADKLMAEMPGILAWCVQGLKNLRERGRFEMPRSSVEALLQYRKESDTERMFFDECLLLDPSGYGMSPNEIYAGYVTWCKASGYRAKSKINFGKRLSEFGITPYRGHGGKRWLVKKNPETNDLWSDAGVYGVTEVVVAHQASSAVIVTLGGHQI
jgi:putative DNA primase/helicase